MKRATVMEPAGDVTAKPTGWFQRHPATTLLALQYGALALWPAWRNHDAAIGFMWWICLIGLLSTFVGESASRVKRFQGSRKHRFTVKRTWREGGCSRGDPSRLTYDRHD